MQKQQYHGENNELVELSVLRYKEQEVLETLMPHAIQIRQTGGPEVLNWTPIEVGEPGSGQVRLRQAAVGLNYIDVYHRTGYYSQPLPFIPGLEGAGTVEAIGQDVREVGSRSNTESLYQLLRDEQFVVALREGKIRVAPHLLNSTQDMDRLLVSLAKVRKGVAHVDH